MHLLTERFDFWDDRGFLKEEVKTYLMAPMWPLNSPTSQVFTSIVLDINQLDPLSGKARSPRLRNPHHLTHLTAMRRSGSGMLMRHACLQNTNHSHEIPSAYQKIRKTEFCNERIGWNQMWDVI